MLYGGTSESPSTSWLTVRSYTSETDYYNEDGSPDSAFDTVQLDDFATVEPTSATATRTTYALADGDAPDDLTIVQDVEVSGTTYQNSFVDITTTVTNEGEGSVDIGIRYFWDWEIGDDDGPSFAQVLPDGPTEVTEQTYTSPTFQYYRIQDNDDVDSPLFAVYGTTAGRLPSSTPPDELMFVAWSDADDVTFDYTTDPNFDVASYNGGENDSAVLYFWGPDEENAITLGPGDSIIVSESLTAAPAGEGPPGRETPTPIRHRTRTPTPEPTDTPAPPTATSMPPVVVVPPATATPGGASGPVISPPLTGDGPSDGSLSPIIPGILAGLLAIGVLGGAVRLRARHR